MVAFEGKFNSEQTQELNKFQLKRIWWLFLVIGLVFMIFVADAIVNKDYATAIGFGVFIVLFPILTIVLTKVFQKGIDKSLHIMSDETKERYEFEDGKVKIIQQKGDEYLGITEAKFSYFYQIIETQTHYFLYISKAQCHLINKQNLVEGTLQELNAMFRQYIQPTKLKLL